MEKGKWKQLHKWSISGNFFLKKFNERPGSSDVINMPELKQVGAAEKSSCNLFDGMESTTQKHWQITQQAKLKWSIYYFMGLYFSLLTQTKFQITSLTPPTCTP